MYSSSRFSVLIPWCDRDEIADTLAQNTSLFLKHSVEVLVLNCGGNTERLQQLLSLSQIPFLRQIEIPRMRFNKSLALNIGVLLSRSSRVFVLDADIVLKSDVLGMADILLEQSAFVTLQKIRESKPDRKWLPCPSREDNVGISGIERNYYVDFHWKDGTKTRLTTNRENVLEGSRAAPGILLVKREYLLEIEGYNSELEYWGWEDCDVQLRLKHVLSLQHIERGVAVHLSHGDERRVLHDRGRAQSHLTNLSILCSLYSKECFRGTYSADVSEWSSKVTELDV